MDDFSRFFLIYFLHNKSEVLRFFSLFKSQVENLFSTSIKTLRTDGGTEYMSILKNHPHIKHELTCPIHHSKTVLLNANTITLWNYPSLLSPMHPYLCLIGTKYLPALFFSSTEYQIIPAQSHIANCSTDNPNSFLRMLGCLCFPYVRYYNNHKLQNRAIPCVFLGYAPNQKGYKYLHIPTNKVCISHHVTFDESSFPFKNNIQTLTPPDSHVNPMTEQLTLPLTLSPILLSTTQPNQLPSPPSITPAQAIIPPHTTTLALIEP
jgi:hypothetical protein